MHLKNSIWEIKNRVVICPLVVIGILISIQIGCKKDMLKEIPSLVTINVTGVTSASITSGGLIFSAGGVPVLSRGICLSTDKNPEITDIKSVEGTGKGSYSSTISGLFAGTTYYVRAYATNICRNWLWESICYKDKRRTGNNNNNSNIFYYFFHSRKWW
jgi:hypothetical protein